MEELAKKLEESGLSSKESVVYLMLLKKAPIGGGDLAKHLNMDRTHVYNLLNNLVNKGLASYTIKNKKTLFQTTSPKDLLNQIHKKEQIVKSIIPELESIEKTKVEPSIVRILEGKAGLRAIYRMVIGSKAKEILILGATGKSYDVLQHEMEHIVKEIESLKKEARILTGEKFRGHEFTKTLKFDFRYVKEITPSSTMIWGDYVSINIFDEKTSLILIKSKSVSDSYKKHFEEMWKIAKK